jgi:hypothetical protein
MSTTTTTTTTTARTTVDRARDAIRNAVRQTGTGQTGTGQTGTRQTGSRAENRGGTRVVISTTPPAPRPAEPRRTPYVAGGRNAVSRREVTSFFFLTINTNISVKEGKLPEGQVDEMANLLVLSLVDNIKSMSNREFADAFCTNAPIGKNPQWNKDDHLYTNDDVADYIVDFKIPAMSVEVGSKMNYLHVHTLWEISHKTRLTISVPAVKEWVRGHWDKHIADNPGSIPPLPNPQSKTEAKTTPYVYVKGYGGKKVNSQGAVIDYILKMEQEQITKQQQNKMHYAFTPEGPSLGTYAMFKENVKTTPSGDAWLTTTAVLDSNLTEVEDEGQ